jgi:nucleoid-associated protein YgaU
MATTTTSPTPAAQVLSAPLASPCRRCAEAVAYDSETEAYVRWREPFVPPALPGVENAEVEVVVEGHTLRLDQLAREHYGDEALWWVLALRNDLDLPDNEVYPGQRLRVPAPDYVRRYILGGK